MSGLLRVPLSWEIDRLFSGNIGAAVLGEVEWTPAQGNARVARLHVYADGIEAVVIVRTALSAPELLHACVNLHDVPVRRGCWNRPHREDGELIDTPLHGHTFSSGRARGAFESEPPLKPIPDNPPIPEWARREAFFSFLDWCQLGRAGLEWVDPFGEGGA